MDSTVTPSDRSAVPLGETAEQKMARLELAISTLQDAPSSHGEPLLPTSWTKPLFVIYLVLSGSGLTLLTQLDASTKVIAIASFVVATLGALLGLSSSGIRKAGTAAALLLVAGSLSLTACRPGSFGDKLLACEHDAAVQVLVPTARCLIDGSCQPAEATWEAALDKLLAQQLAAAPCVIDAVIAALEHQSAPTAIDGMGGMTPDAAARWAVHQSVSLNRAWAYRHKLEQR
jgi:hypothetical protein